MAKNKDLEISKEEINSKIESPWTIAFKRLKKNKLAWASLIILTILVIMAITAPLITPMGFNDMVMPAKELPPSLELYPISDDYSVFTKTKDKSMYLFTSNGEYIDLIDISNEAKRKAITTKKLEYVFGVIENTEGETELVYEDLDTVNEKYTIELDVSNKNNFVLKMNDNRLSSTRKWNKTYILGTDKIGRDIYTRIVYGSRVSLSVGVVAVSLRVFLGLLLGSLAGYYGGVVDGFIMRFADMVMCFPFLLICITMVVILGPSIYNVMLVLGLLGWPGIARIVRGQMLSLREQEFMEAAEALGIRDSRKIFKHLIPNVMSSVIVFATMGMAGAIMTEAGLSFLGLGVQPPTPSWGNMIQASRSIYALQNQWWLWVPPGLSIFITVMTFNLLGDGLRDALDPKLSK